MTEENSDDESPLESFEPIGNRLSRRSFVEDVAKVGGGAAVLSASGGVATAGGDGDGDDGDGDDGDDASDEESDLDILNFALTLEKLETTFYEGGLATSGGVFDEDDIENSDVARQFADPSIRHGTFQRFEEIRDNERAHVEFLTDVIEEAGGDPVSGLTFEFPYENVEEFVALARTLENTGTAAYTGAAPMLENTEYVGSAAQILAVEARHASYLRLLNEQSPFPDPFQPTLTMEQVRERVAPFIVD